MQRYPTQKLFGTGSCTAFIATEEEYRDIILRALSRSLRTKIFVDEKAFLESVISQGVPEEVAIRCLRTIVIDDETYLVPRHIILGLPEKNFLTGTDK